MEHNQKTHPTWYSLMREGQRRRLLTRLYLVWGEPLGYVGSNKWSSTHVSGGADALLPRSTATALPAGEGEADALHDFTSAARLLMMDTATSYRLTAMCSSVVLPPSFVRVAAKQTSKNTKARNGCLVYSLFAGLERSYDSVDGWETQHERELHIGLTLVL